VKKAKLHEDALAIVEDLVETGRVSRKDADLFVRVATVWAVFKLEAAAGQRDRVALPWWRRW